MEDNVQTIIVIIISAFILFIFPVYLAYEKKDDISYALAMRYTQNLVDDVRSKGYLSREMYSDYKVKLKITGNAYNIDMTHEYNRYDPITNYYKIETDAAGNKKYVLVKTTTQEERKEYENELIMDAIARDIIGENASDETIEEFLKAKYLEQDIDKVENTYKASKEIYKTEHIEAVLESENKLNLNSNGVVFNCNDEELDCKYAYIMNTDDNFNITIKNTNTTLATVVYNMVTANTLDENTRIYVNYGGTILSTKWYGDIDYSKMKHDRVSLTRTEELIIFTEERHFTEESCPKAVIGRDYSTRYAIEFDVKPEETTELREKGKVTVTDYSGYNFALGNNNENNEEYMLSVSVGINGITLIANKTPCYAIPTQQITLPTERIEITNVGGGLSTQPRRMKLSDYEQLRVYCPEKGKLTFELKGKKGIPNYTKTINVPDPEYILEGLDYIKNDPKNSATEVKNLGTATNKRGTKINCRITTSGTTISVDAKKYVSEEETLLSYPVSINDYTRVKIEFTKTEDDCYIANLYLNETKVAESVKLYEIPKVNVVGKTFIGNEEREFRGYIKNAKIYELI